MLSACIAALRAPGPRPLTLRGRSVPVDEIAGAFPFWRVIPDYDSGRWIAFRDGPGSRTIEARRLPTGVGRLDERASVRLDRGSDWRGRNYWGMRFDPKSRAMIVWADAHADEANQLWSLPLDGGVMTRLTDVASVMGFGVDSAGRIAYLARRAGSAPFTTCVHVREDGADREIVCDEKAMRFAPGSLEPLPGGAWLATARIDGDRNRVTLVRVDPIAKRVTPLLPGARRAVANPLAPVVDDDSFLFLSDESGTTELWRYQSGAARRLTSFGREVASAVVLEPGPRALAAVLLGGPQATELRLLSPDDGRVVWTDTIPANAEILDATKDRFYLVRDSQSEPVAVEEWILRDDGVHLSREIEPRLAPSDAARAAMVQCDAEAVEIPTFDEDPATHAPRTMPAWLLTPKRPPVDDAQRFALVRGFYGGENVFDTEAQLLCAAGGASLSPAIRGSSGFGAAYAALNDGDMGGDEVYDLFRAGAWLSARLKIPASRVGIWGGSHGGYEVLRALTFPEGVNGHHEPRFEFGFGIAHSAIADLPALAGTTRIPDWLSREAGTDPARLKDRSPLEHVDLLRAPVLLTAGKADTRVPIAQSRAFAAKARAVGKDVTLVELEGQGHHVEGLDAERTLWSARLAFLARTLP